jgi:hypothetical protein
MALHSRNTNKTSFNYEVNFQQVNFESMYEALSPHFKEEYEFFSKLSVILNKILTQETFTDEEKHIVSLNEPFAL